MRLIRYISFIILATAINSSYAQSWTKQAYDFHNAKDHENAKSAIDSAITTNERFDSQTWQLRGIIYRNVSNDDQLYYREISIESFIRAEKLDSAGVYSQKINEYLNATVVRYYNDAVTLLLDHKEFEKSEESYNTYKRHYNTLIESGHDFSGLDIDYYNAVGSEYLAKVDLVEPSRKNSLREKSLLYCAKVLHEDSLNGKANLNSGIVYYNIAVDYITAQDPFITIEDLILNQKKSEDAFLKALPFLHKAEDLQPANIKIWEALMGCYYSLNNDEMYLKYQTMADRENLPNYLQRYKTHPKDLDNIKQLIRVYTKTLINEEEANRLKLIVIELEKEE